MITFELNNPATFTLTSAQLVSMAEVVQQNGFDLRYDVVESDATYPHVKFWVHHREGNPSRLGINHAGEIIIDEAVDWDWKGTSS